MPLLEQIKNLFTEERRLSRVTIETPVPLPDSSYCYVIQRAAKKLELTGWVTMAPGGCLKSEFEGSRESIEQLIRQFSSGVLLPHPPPLNIMWSTFRGRFRDLEVRL